MRFVAIDTETTGLDPDKCQLVEVAFIHCTITPRRREVDVFHRYILPRDGEYAGDEVALSMNRATIDRIVSGEVEAVNERQLTKELGQFLKNHGYQAEGFVPCGKNVMGFDLRFLRRLPGWGYPLIKHKYRAIDVGTLMLRHDDDCPPDLKECKKRAGLPERVTHRATDDALDCCDIVHWWYKQQRKK